MRGANARGVFAVVVCSFATALLGACSEPVDPIAPPGAAGESAGDTADAPIAAAGCLSPTAGSGFAPMAVTPVTRFAVLDFTATASDANLDGVIGFTSGSTSGFDRLAMAVRFAPGGVIDVRNGGA